MLDEKRVKRAIGQAYDAMRHTLHEAYFSREGSDMLGLLMRLESVAKMRDRIADRRRALAGHALVDPTNHHHAAFKAARRAAANAERCRDCGWLACHCWSPR